MSKQEVLEFGPWLKAQRDAQGLSRARLALRINYSAVAIKKIEASQRTPSETMARLLAQALAFAPDQHPSFVRFARAGRWEKTLVQLLLGLPGGHPDQLLQAVPVPAELDSWLETAQNPARPRPAILAKLDSLTNPVGEWERIPPMPLNTLVGRAQELSRALHLLAQPGVRLVTLTGPPGVGKTRLALEIAQHSRPRGQLNSLFAQGVVFVPLAAVSPARENEPLHPVMSAIVTALNLHLQPNELHRDTLPETLVQHLQPLKLLLVLDNFEHVLSATPMLIRLLEEAAGLKILVTSREPLHLYGEHRLTLSPLRYPLLEQPAVMAVDESVGATAFTGPIKPVHADLQEAEPTSSNRWAEFSAYPAIALFVQRVIALRPDFELTEANALPIARICALVDGLPLAIEMAALHMAEGSPDALLARLQQHLTSLATGSQQFAAPSETLTRFHSIEDMVAWSYSLLTPEQRLVFGALSVCADSADAATLEAMVSLPLPINPVSGEATFPVAASVAGPYVLPLLSTLLDKGLIRQSLPDNGAYPGAARFGMLMTLRQFGRSQLQAAGLLDALHLRHAQHLISQMDTSLEASPEIPQAPDGFEAGDVVLSRPSIQRLLRDSANLAGALSWSQQSVHPGSVAVAVHLTMILLDAWLASGILNDVQTLYPQTLVKVKTYLAGLMDVGLNGAEETGVETAGDRIVEPDGDGLLSEIDWASKAFVVLAERTDWPPVVQAAFVRLIGLLGVLNLHRNQWASASHLLTRSVELSRRAGDQIGEYWAWINLSAAQGHLQQEDRVTASLDAAIGLARAMHSSALLSLPLLSRSNQLRRKGHLDEALTLSSEGVQLARQSVDARALLRGYYSLGQVLVGLGRYNDAHELFLKGLDYAGRSRHLRGMAWCRLGLANLALATHQPMIAAYILGSDEAERAAQRNAIDYLYQPDYDAVLHALKQAMSEHDLTQAWREGRTLGHPRLYLLVSTLMTVV